MADGSPLKRMYLNPVGTPDYDGVFADMARAVKLPGTEVHVTSLKPADGAFTHIEYRSYEAVVSTGIVRAARAAAAEGFDALAVGCFYDTALHEAREVSGDMVVTAPCAASLEIAASLANRFGIIVGRRKWVHQMNAAVRDNGMAERLSGFYPVELGVTGLSDRPRRDRVASHGSREDGRSRKTTPRRSSSDAPWRSGSTTALRRLLAFP